MGLEECGSLYPSKTGKSFILKLDKLPYTQFTTYCVISKESLRKVLEGKKFEAKIFIIIHDNENLNRNVKV